MQTKIRNKQFRSSKQIQLESKNIKTRTVQFLPTPEKIFSKSFTIVLLTCLIENPFQFLQEWTLQKTIRGFVLFYLLIECTKIYFVSYFTLHGLFIFRRRPLHVLVCNGIYFNPLNICTISHSKSVEKVILKVQ